MSCGRTGHSAQRCPKPKAHEHERPCFKYWQKGSFANNCTAGTAAKVIEQADEPTGPNHWGLCFEVVHGDNGTCQGDCHGVWEKHKKTCKPQPHQATFGDFLSPNQWEKLGEPRKPKMVPTLDAAARLA